MQVLERILRQFRKTTLYSIFQNIYNLLPEKTFIVGGTIRDLLLKRDPLDLDIVLFEGEPGSIAYQIARKLKGAFFALDIERDEYRVVINKNITIDLIPKRGITVEEDLLKRDFTINAVALDIKGRKIFDPLKGIDDIKRGLIRQIHRENLIEDPLRLLRAVRLQAETGFKIEKETLESIHQLKGEIHRAARERVKDELFFLFGRGNYVIPAIETLKDTELLFEIMPELSSQKGVLQRYEGFELDIFEHTIEVAKNVCRLEKNLKKTLFSKFDRKYYEEWFSEPRKPLLYFSAFYHDIAKPLCITEEDGKTSFIGHDREGAIIAKKWAKKMRLSREESKILHRVVKFHMYPHLLGKEQELTRRAIFRYLRKTDDLWFFLFLLAYCDFRATPPGKDPSYLKKLVNRVVDFYEESQKEMPKPLIDGYDLIDLGFKPGPIFRKILQDVEEKRAEGRIKDKNEAIKYVKENWTTNT